MRLFACVMLVGSWFLLADTAAAQTVFRMVAGGGQVEPATASAETGEGIFYLDPASGVLRYDVSISGLSGTLDSMHLHLGAPGDNGVVIATLAGGPTSFAGEVTLSAADQAALLAGDLYVDIHSGAHPAGEIRGQLVPGLEQFVAIGRPWKHVHSVTSPATAELVFTINPDQSVSYFGHFRDLVGSEAFAHVHGSRAGATGAVIFNLQKTTGPGRSGTYQGTSQVLTDGELARLRAGHTYLNVHSLTFPPGELRGQLVPSFDRYGQGCNGTTTLSGSGIPTPGESVELTVSGGTPDASPGLMLFSQLGRENSFANGCALYPGAPINAIGLAPLDGNGELSVPADIPTALGPLPAPITLQLQYFGADPAQTGGFFSSNAMTVFIDD